MTNFELLNEEFYFLRFWRSDHTAVIFRFSKPHSLNEKLSIFNFYKISKHDGLHENCAYQG